MTEPSQHIHDLPRVTHGGDQPSARGDWFKALIRIVTSPRKSFRIIGRSSPWLPAMLLILFGTLVLVELNQPYQEKAMRAELARALPGNAEQADQVLAQMEQARQGSPVVRWAGRAMAGAAFVVKLFIQTLFVWLLAVAFLGQVRFVHALSLMVHLSVIAHLQAWAALFIASRRGLDAIQAAADLEPAPGLNLLLAGDNAALNVVWASVNPFTIWFLVLLGLGSAAVLGLPRRRGYLLAGLYWASTTALAAATVGVAARLTPG